MSRIESIVKTNMNSYLETPQKKGKQDNIDYRALSQPIAAKYSTANLQAYHFQKNVSFGRLLSEHLQHGGYVDAAGNFFFDLLTHPDVQKVSVVIAKKVKSAVNSLKEVFEITTHEMQRDSSQRARVFKLKLGSEHVQDGDKYAFEIIKDNGERLLVSDPYAKRKDIFFLDPESENGYLDAGKLYRTDRFAEIYDHSKFPWHDSAWVNGQDKRRISDLSNVENGMKSYQEARQYQLNIATFTEEGTFDAAIVKLGQMIEEGKWFREDGYGAFNTIQLMPVGSCNSKEWGYDDIFKAAVSGAYGGPDGLKRLIDYAHSKGINIAADVVPNHFDLDNSLLHEIGPYLGEMGDCGFRPNFENDPVNNPYVRDWITNICGLNWVRDFHVDILRLDLTQNMKSDRALSQFIRETRHHHKHTIVVLEDGREEHLSKLLSRIPDIELALGRTESEHVKIIERYDTNQESLEHIDANSRWAYEYNEELEDACSGTKSTNNVKQRMLNAANRGEVIYAPGQSHDARGKRTSLPPVALRVQERLDMAPRNIPPGVEWLPPESEDRARYSKIIHEAAVKVQTLIRAIVSEQRPDSISPELYAKGIEAVNYGLAQNRVSIGLTASLPAPHMRFQGKWEPFYFFRTLATNTDIDNNNMLRQRGYLPDEAARKASIVDSTPLSEKYREISRKDDQFEIDINEFAARNKAMSKGYIYEDTTISHPGSRVLGTHIKKDESEVFSISNFSDDSFNGNYRIKFPKGEWKVVICSQDVKYAGSGKDIQTKLVISDGTNESEISIPANSFTLFEKVEKAAPAEVKTKSEKATKVKKLILTGALATGAIGSVYEVIRRSKKKSSQKQ